MVLETLLKVVQVLIALAMIGFILVQRGSGAQAGSGFGAGASGTVFGARGAASFLTRATAVLAAAFFVVSLVMAVYTARTGIKPTQASDDLGIMTSVIEAQKTAADVPTLASPATIPAAAPTVAPAATDVPSAREAPARADVPKAPLPADAEKTKAPTKQE